ncbi:MAG: glutamyl-tRNA reductase [Myxococcales bacterium]|nr:glutamyl-tRNA reductase [Myxococcales bacterium]
MSDLVAVGLNHKTAPVELRESVAGASDEIGELLHELQASAGLQEAMVVSTCNRVEIYGVARSWAQAGERSLRILAERRGVAPDALVRHGFIRGSRDAAEHIFRVAASLESMVVGEPQILGQVKDAYDQARSLGTVGAVLDRCLTSAFRGAKRVRTETAIARGAASVSSVAVDLARSIFGDLSDCAALLVGAGEMAQQAGINLRSGGIAGITVVNRGRDRGEALAAELGGRFAPWENLSEQLQRADIVITSTGSSRPVIDRALLKPVMRARRGAPIFLVDIAVPRDVDGDVLKLEQVFLYNIDDLQGIVDENMRSRAGEAERAALLLEAEIEGFVGWQRSRSVGPVIQRLHQRAREIADGELERLGGRLGDLSPAQRKAVESLAHGIVRKLLHQPVTALREAAKGDDAYAATALAEAVETLFGVEETETAEASADDPALAAAANPAKSV